MSASLAGITKKHLAPLEERIAALEKEVCEMRAALMTTPIEEPADETVVELPVKKRKARTKTYGTE